MPTTYPDRPQGHLYRKHDHADGYTIDPGRFIIPLAVDEPTDAAELATFVPFVTVQAYCPIAYRTAEFDTTKDGAPPQIIPPQTQGPFIFLGGEIGLLAPQMMANGGKTWQITGQHNYAVAGAVSLAVQTGFVMQSLPILTTTQYALNQTYGTGQVPNDLVVSASGADVKACYAEAIGVSFTGNDYSYFGVTLFPGQFFNESLLIGNTIFTGLQG